MHNKFQLTQVLKKHNVPVTVLADTGKPANTRHEKKLIKLLKEGLVSEAQIDSIIAFAPHLIDLAKNAASLKSESQKEAFKTHSEVSKSGFLAQVQIAEKAKSDRTRERISDNIVEMNRDDNKTQAELNRNNNGSWLALVGGAALAVGGLALSVIAKKK